MGNRLHVYVTEQVMISVNQIKRVNIPYKYNLRLKADEELN